MDLPLLMLSWYRLNCGCWKDVADHWRHVYGLCLVLMTAAEILFNPEPETKRFIEQCDRAILMGGPRIEPIASALVSTIDGDHEMNLSPNLDRFQTNDDDPAEMSDNRVHQLESPPSLIEFKQNFYDRNVPVKVKNAIGHWPAMEKWSFEYFLNEIGNRVVPIELGANYTDTSWTQRLLTFREFYHEFLVPEDHHEKGYLAQHPLLDQIPKLKEDICVPDYCCLGTQGCVDLNIWIGPSNTISPLHQDPKPNFLCQIRGTKFIRMIDTKYRNRVYPFPSDLISNTSQVDVLNPDYEKFPLYEEVPFTDTLLEPGSMLYIPPGYWHYVKSLSASISLSVWFE